MSCVVDNSERPTLLKGNVEGVELGERGGEEEGMVGEKGGKTSM